MKIALGSDHGGFEIKEALREALAARGVDAADLGARDKSSVDYPDFAQSVAGIVSQGEADQGILVCTSGIGMSIAANKLPGVRAAAVHDEIGADISRRHTDANVLCLPADMLGLRISERIVRTFLTTEFESGRHARRVAKIAAIEKGRDPTKLETEPPVPEAR